MGQQNQKEPTKTSGRVARMLAKVAGMLGLSSLADAKKHADAAMHGDALGPIPEGAVRVFAPRQAKRNTPHPRKHCKARAPRRYNHRFKWVRVGAGLGLCGSTARPSVTKHAKLKP